MGKSGCFKCFLVLALGVSLLGLYRQAEATSSRESINTQTDKSSGGKQLQIDLLQIALQKTIKQLEDKNTSLERKLKQLEDKNTNLEKKLNFSIFLISISLLISLLSIIASSYKIFEMNRGTPITGKSRQNGASQNLLNQSTHLPSSQENVITREELAELVNPVFSSLNEKLQRLENNFPNNLQSNRTEGNIAPFPASTPPPSPQRLKPQESSDIKLVEAYNRDPGSLLHDAIEVTEIKDSIAQRRLGVNQTVVLEKVGRGKGNYWVLPSKGYNYLVPKKGIRINEYNYETVEALFLCYNYQPGYSDFQLHKPARLSPLSQGETWQLIEQGELQF
jgi:cell division protein FtsB